MAEIKSGYNKQETKIKRKQEENMKEIDENLNFKSLAEEEDKKRNIINTLVNEKKESVFKSEDIICPICKKIVFITALDYKLFFHGNNCKHRFRNILLKDYEKTQNIDVSCEKCKEGNKNTQKFFICLKCNINLCQHCKDKHEKEKEKGIEHIIKEYNLRNFFCSNHFEKYSKFCLQCKKNLCKECIDHKDQIGRAHV